MIKLIEWDQDALNANTIGSIFKRLRQEKNLTLRDLSESAGLSLYTIQSIEKGRKDNPTLYTMAAILDALDKELTIREKNESDINTGSLIGHADVRPDRGNGNTD